MHTIAVDFNRGFLMLNKLRIADCGASGVLNFIEDKLKKVGITVGSQTLMDAVRELMQE